MFEHEKLQTILDTIDPLLADSDRYKQRSGAELLAGLSRGQGVGTSPYRHNTDSA